MVPVFLNFDLKGSAVLGQHSCPVGKLRVRKYRRSGTIPAQISQYCSNSRREWQLTAARKRDVGEWQS